jgi:hypothetical protein
MSKKVSSELTGIVLTFGILSSFIGIKETFNIIKQILSMLNSILISFYDTTILNVMFKYFITFPIVGLILMILGSPRGKEGHWIGKILYFIVGYGIGFLLDIVSKLVL